MDGDIGGKPEGPKGSGESFAGAGVLMWKSDGDILDAGLVPSRVYC